jgi:hypothetical protein
LETNKKYNPKGIKSSLNSENACYFSVFRLLSKYGNNNNYIFAFVLYGCKGRAQMRVLRRILGP